jgi:hypothetical protein
MDWAAAAAGLRNSRTEDLRKRQEMAKAFAEYRAANPYATAAEYQDFIDRYSGGRNYIAGGAPSASILRAIGMENQKRKAQEEMRQRLSDIQTRQQTIQSLQQLADDALMNMEGDDFTAVRDQVLGQFGEGAESMLSGFNLDTLFSPTRKKALDAERMRKLLPGAIDFARTAGSVLKSSDIAALYPDLPKSVIEPLVAEANRVRQKEMDEEARKVAIERANAETNVRTSLSGNTNFQAALRSGDMKKAREIAAREAARYNSIFTDAPLGDDFLTGIIDENLEGQQAIQLSEHQKLYQDSQSKQFEAITKIEENSMASVNMAFRASENGTPSTRAGGDALHNSNALFAAQRLATMFDTSQSGAVDILTTTFQMAADRGATIEQLTQMGAEALATGGIPTLEVSKQRAAMARGMNMPEMKSFPDWKIEIETDIREDFAILDKGIQDAIMLTDPKQLQSEIANIANAIEQTRAAYGGAIQDARVNQNIWIPVGAEGWDDTQVFGGRGSVQATMDAEIAKLNQKLNALTQRALAMTQQGEVAPQGNGFGVPPGTAPTASPTTTPAGPQTGAQEFFGALVNPERGAAKQALAEAQFELATGGSGLPAAAPLPEIVEFFTRPKDENFDADNMLAERGNAYFQDPAAVEWVMEDPSRIQLLKDNPRKAIQELEAWFNKRNGSP